MLTFLDKIPYGSARIRRIVFWSLSTFLAYILFGFLALPPIVKSIIVSQAQDALQRTTTVEKVYFNPLTLHIEVNGVKVSKKEGEGNLISIDSFLASPGIASLWKLAPVVSYLHLRNLAVDVTFYGDGQYSFSDLIGSRQQADENESEETPIFPFALYGFEMTNATIVFDDRSHNKKHLISNFDLLVPFTSSFQDLKKEFTQPKFKAVVNGDPVELTGRTLPFDDSLLTEFELGAVNIDLNQYWRYLPVESHLQLLKGQFSSNLSLFFERPEAQRIKLFLGGGGTLTDFELSAPKDGKVLALNKLSFEMERYSLGDHTLVLNDVTMTQPYFKVVRRKNNDINWAGYFPGSKVTDKGAEIQTKDEDVSLLLDIRALNIKDGFLEWNDHAVPGGFKQDFPKFNFSGKEISTYGEKPCVFDVSIGEKGMVALKGSATLKPLAAKTQLTAHDIRLPRYHPYLAQVLPMKVETGTLDLAMEINAIIDGETKEASLHNGSLTLNGIALHKPETQEPSLGLTRLNISGVEADLKRQMVEVGEITLTGPMVRVVKEKEGTIDLVRLFNEGGQERGGFSTDNAKLTSPETGTKPWTATIHSLKLAEGSASFKDLAMKHPASLSIDGLQGEIKNITTQKGEEMTHAISTRWAKRGEISLNGNLSLDTLKGNGTFKVRSMALRPLDGHLGHFTELLFASGSAAADLKYAFDLGDKPKFNTQGTVGLYKVRLKDAHGKGEFAGIDAFKLAGIRFSNEPYRLSIADIHLDGPHAVIDFDKQGRLNIRRAFRIPEPPPVSPEEKKTQAKTKAREDKAAKKKTAKKTEAPPKPKAEPGLFEKIDIGKITMVNGRVSFRDATVSPVYMTQFTDMKLGLLNISQSQEARPNMDFSAKIGPTPVSVTGVVNPVITPIYSDLAIAVNGMELVPLSPYTVKHLAYPITKGRLYADVKFKTENWELDASNKFFVEQLKLGPKDKRPDAPNIPVTFGLALLQDGNGDVELNLPIKGRLDDPDFRIGGIVFKAIASLFVKALASPFSLIGSIFGGGGEDMDFVVFQPGRHQLDVAGKQKLETTITALKKRAKLDLEVDGVVDPVVDKQGLVEVIFETKLKQQKFDSLTRKERAETTVDAMIIAPEEYEDFLFEAYADEPDEEGIKPTTLFMTDRMPLEFMEKFILERIIVTDDDLKTLANQRANAVKTHIINRDAALTERIFLLDNRKKKKGKTGVPNHRADMGIK